MTTVRNRQPARRAIPVKALAIGLCAGLLSASAAAGAPQLPFHAPGILAMAQAAAIDPAKQVPGVVSVSAVDFKRGDGGAGKLILRFDGEGASPDLRTQGSNIVVNIGNASLPASLQRPLNVSDFATPVQRIDARQGGEGAQLVLSAQGNFESMAYQTGRDYVVEIVPRAAASDRAVGASSPSAVTAAAQGSAARSYSGRPVTFNFQDVPVRTVLQLIAEESNLNIVASDTVTGNVTLRLINVPWDQALDIVLQARQLDQRRSGNVVWVAPQAEIAAFEKAKEDARLELEERAEMVTQYIPISYGNAEDIAKLLTDESKNSMGSGAQGGGQGQQESRGFLSRRGSLSFDRRTNTLLVIDIPQRVNEIQRLVTMLDKPVDQVVIEARIVIANESFARDLGARFGVYGAKDRLITSGSVASNQSYISSSNAFARDPEDAPFPSFTNPLNFSSAAGAGAGSLALTILGNYVNWDLEISALQQEGRGEVVSNPRVVTSNQKEAVIRQGQEIGYLTVTGGQSNSIPTVEFKDVLLELKVTPTITNDGRVFLNMALKKDEVSDYISIGDDLGEVPVINKREITTAVLVEDGQTVSIGGVYEFTERSDLTKVPFLGDLPILGNLFKKRGRDRSKAELLIFVTPKVLRVAQR